jgi:transcriptional regulator with XRE-family HTH domain
MSDRQTFGPRLRRERERRGITLDTIAAATKVSADLWDGLERNDFSRWPAGIFARAFVRDYARAVGLDADEIVDEFCRLFPIGDRRAARIIKAQAELIGHAPAPQLEKAMLPPEGDRRGPGRGDERNRVRFAPRWVAAGLDAACTLTLSGMVALVFHAPFLSVLGVIGTVYFGGAIVLLGTTPGLRAAELLRQRMPALFAVQNRRAHA